MAYLGSVFKALICVLSLGLMTPIAQADTLQSLAHYQGQDRQQRLVEGAKKEGSLLLYTAMQHKYLTLFTEPFEKKYGIKVIVWRASGESILQRTVNEARAGSPVVDVVHSTALITEALTRENVLQEIHSPAHKLLIPSAVPPHHKYAGTFQYVFVQAYNTDLVKKEDLPKTYNDLLDPKWKGKLAIEANDHDWMASVIDDMGQEKGSQFFKDLVAKNDLSVRKGHTLLTNLVVAGEVPLALTIYQYSVNQPIKKGAPVGWFAIEPAVSVMSGMGVASQAPHPHAALLFYDYMLSPEAQKTLAKMGHVPTSTEVESPLKDLKLKHFDIAAVFDGQEKSEAQFQSILKTQR